MQSKPDPTGHSFSAYFKRATSPLVVLRLLAEKPMYGYELNQEMKQRSGGDFTISVLYPVLYRLEEQGYIYVSESRVVDGRARSYYAVTKDGLVYLQETMADYEHISGVFATLMKGADSMEREAITTYCQAVEKNLDLPKQQKKRLLDGLRRELEERDETTSDLLSPEETAAELMESVAPETVSAYHKKNKRRLQSAVAVMAVLFLLFVCVWLWGEQTQITRAESKIIVTEIIEE